MLLVPLAAIGGSLVLLVTAAAVLAAQGQTRQAVVDHADQSVRVAAALLSDIDARLVSSARQIATTRSLREALQTGSRGGLAADLVAAQVSHQLDLVTVVGSDGTLVAGAGALATTVGRREIVDMTILDLEASTFDWIDGELWLLVGVAQGTVGRDPVAAIVGARISSSTLKTLSDLAGARISLVSSAGTAGEEPPDSWLAETTFRTTHDSAVTVRAALALAPYRFELIRSVVRIAAVGSVILLLFVALGFWVVGKAVRPLDRLAAAAASFAAEGRVDPVGTDGPREIAATSEAFNHMVTAVRTREAALRQAILESRDHSAGFHSLIDGALDAFVGMDGEGRITDFTAQAESLTGWRRDEIRGRTIWETLLPPLAHRALPSPVAWLDRTGGTRAADRGRFPLLHRDGQLIQCEMATMATRTASGKVVAGIFLHDISEEERRDAQLQELALFDTLTGLPNRTLFEDRFMLARAAAGRDGRVGLAILGLDHFKAVNEPLGTATGDEVLREMARRLSAAVAPGDTLAYSGGDEFGLVLDLRSGDRAAVNKIHECLSAIRQPLSVDGHTLHLTASAGLRVGRPADGSFAEFLRAANFAAAEARQSGGDSLSIAKLSPTDSDIDEIGLVADLHLALDREELYLEYQPIIDLTSSECERVEALVRWTHPVRGLIRPADFIPLAERSHLIRSVGYWVLERALDDLEKWRAAGSHIGVCVNVSSKQLTDPGFLDTVLRTTASRGLPEGTLTLELTEATFIDRTSPLITTLAALRAAGVRISIDDFGTGYSSVAQLGALPLDEVKIDRTFVAAATSDPGRAAVVRATAALAAAFHIPFVAEGVEDQATWDFLRELGRGSAQGYFVGRPMPLEALAPWLESWKRRSAVEFGVHSGLTPATE